MRSVKAPHNKGDFMSIISGLIPAQLQKNDRFQSACKLGNRLVTHLQSSLQSSVGQLVNHETLNIAAATIAGALVSSSLGYATGAVAAFAVYVAAESGRLVNRVTQLESKNQALTVENKLATKELATLKKDGHVESLTSRIAQLEAENSESKENQSSLREALQKETGKNSELECAAVHAKAQLTNFMKNGLPEQKAQVEALQLEVTKLSSTIEALKSDKKALETAYTSDVQSKNEEIALAKREITELHSAGISNTDLIETLVQKVLSLESERDSLTTEQGLAMKDSQSQIEELTDQCSSLSAELVRVEMISASQNSQLLSASESYMEAQEQIAALSELKGKVEEAFEQFKTQAQTQISQLTVERDIASDAFFDLENQTAELKHNMSTVESELALVKDSNSQQLKEIKHRYESAMTGLSSIQGSIIRGKSEKIAQLEADIATLAKEVQILMQSKDSMQAEHSLQQQTLTDYLTFWMEREEVLSNEIIPKQNQKIVEQQDLLESYRTAFLARVAELKELKDAVIPKQQEIIDSLSKQVDDHIVFSLWQKEHLQQKLAKVEKQLLQLQEASPASASQLANSASMAQVTSPKSIPRLTDSARAALKGLTKK